MLYFKLTGSARARFLPQHVCGADCEKASKKTTDEASGSTHRKHTHAPRAICFAVTARGVTATFLLAQNERTRKPNTFLFQAPP